MENGPLSLLSAQTVAKTDRQGLDLKLQDPNGVHVSFAAG